MGVYSNNRFAFNEGYGSFVEDVEPDLSYFGQAGADRILAEAAQNDLKMFDAIIANDFQEAYLTKAMNEGANCADQIVALQEASVGGIFGRLKEFLKKIWAKIKGLIESFLTKIRGAVTSDNKKLVDKFKKQINNGSSKLSKMKYKWSEPKNGLTFGLEKKYEAKGTSMVESIMGIGGSFTSATKAPNEIAKSCYALEKELGKDDYDDEQLSKYVPSTSVADFAKDAHEHFFEDEDEEDGTFGSKMTEIMSTLTNAEKNTKDITKAQEALDKYFREQIKNAQKMEDTAIKAVGNEKTSTYTMDSGHKQDSFTAPIGYAGNDTKDKLYTHQLDEKIDYGDSKITIPNLFAKVGATLQQFFSRYQTNLTRLLNAEMAARTFHIKQCRRVWIQAASYAVKSVKEDAMLFDAIGESADFETDQLIGY